MLESIDQPAVRFVGQLVATKIRKLAGSVLSAGYETQIVLSNFQLLRVRAGHASDSIQLRPQ